MRKDLTAEEDPNDETELDQLNGTESHTERVPFYQIIREMPRREQMYYCFGTLSAWVLGTLVPMFFLLAGQMLDELTDEEEDDYDFNHEMVKLCFIEVGIGLTALVSGYIGVVLFIWVGQETGRRMRSQYFKAILGKDVMYYDVNPKEAIEVPSKMNLHCEAVEAGMGEKLMAIMEVLMYFLVGFGICIERSPQLFLVALSIAPLNVLGSILSGTAMLDLAPIREKAYAKAGGLSEEALIDNKTVSAYNAQEYVSSKYNKELDESLKVAARNSTQQGIGWGCLWSSWLLYGVVVYWVAAGWVSDERKNWIWGDDIEAADALIVFFLMAYMCIILGNLVPGIMALINAERAAYQIRKFVPEHFNEAETGSTAAITGEIEFRDVKFAYPKDPARLVLKGVSFQMQARRSYALVGESGAGKSTVIQLIERFYEPLAGEILLDGQALGSYSITSLRKQIGYVCQEPILFNLTIRENIMLGNPKATQAELERAAKDANIYSFIQGLEDKFETDAGSKGSMMSGGQKQRIAIARAIIRKPKILLLDEATSALDNMSEVLVLQALRHITERQDLTTISVAQKLSTIQSCDEIFVIAEGVVTEHGSHAELIRKNGVYTQMCEAQGVNIEYLLTEEAAKSSTHPDEIEHVSLSKQETEAESLLDVPIYDALKYALVYWPLLAVGLVCACVDGAAFPLFGFIIGKENYYLAGRSGDAMEDTIRKFALCTLVLAIVLFFGFALLCLAFGLLTAYVSRDLRTQAFSQLLHNDAEFFDAKGNNPTVLSQSLSQDTDRLNTAGGILIAVFLMMAVGLILSAGISLYWQLYLGLTFVALMPIQLYGFIRGWIMHTTGAVHPSHKAANGMVSDTVINLKTVKAYTIEEDLSARYDGLIENICRDTYGEAHSAGLTFGISQMFIFFVYAVIFLVSGYLQKWDQASYEDICVVLYTNMLTSLSILIGAMFSPGLTEGSRAAKRILGIIKYKPGIDALKEGFSGEVAGPITFDKVKFKYATRDNTVITGISFTVPRNHRVGITGASGSGKTTVIQLLLRFYDVSEGSILINGHDIKEYNVKHLRRSIASVGQEPVLFSGSLRHNVAFGLKEGGQDVSDEKIHQALAKAKVDFTSDLEHEVGTRGSAISGGQKQRVAIARAILRDPTILLLDEATSALDSKTEGEIMHTLDEVGEGKTVIIIAHRLSTIRKCDCIYVMEAGGFIESGSHEELMLAKGHYWRLTHTK